MPMISQLTDFFNGYINCMLWSSDDDRGNPLEDTYGIEDLSTECLEQVHKDCNTFIGDNLKHFILIAGDLISIDYSQHGHDFWLTRNGHGAGFWDRGYNKNIGEILTDNCKQHRELHPFVDDNNQINAE